MYDVFYYYLIFSKHCVSIEEDKEAGKQAETCVDVSHNHIKAISSYIYQTGRPPSFQRSTLSFSLLSISSSYSNEFL